MSQPVLRSDPAAVHSTLKEAVVDGILNLTYAQLSGQGPTGQYLFGARPRAILNSGFLLPQRSPSGDDEVKFGSIDILVNCAAMDPKFDPDAAARGITPGSFEDYPLDQGNAALNVNLTGMFLITQACVKQMVAQGKKGSIINICSTYGLNGPDQRIYVKDGKRVAYKPVYYTTTKAGVMGITKYLAAYYAETEIRVNALTPGGVYNNHEEYFVKNYSAKTILGRMAKKDELNGALLFLASDASSYMTGNNVIVDGGWTAW